MAEHVHAQLDYKGHPSRATAKALLDAPRRVVRACGGKGDGSNILDSVEIRREHMLTNPALQVAPRGRAGR
jgi:hypothetical protein